MEPIFLDVPASALAGAAVPPTAAAAAAAAAASGASAPSSAAAAAAAEQKRAAQAYNTVHVHPVVLFSILDQYVRREAAGDKVIGAFALRAGALFIPLFLAFFCGATLFLSPLLVRASSRSSPSSLQVPCLGQ